MVVFTCGHCGESVQKPKVEKHYMTKCRNRNPNLSCMDCFKDFFGQDYEAHFKCITEEERYSGKGFVSKEKKGEKKQSTWVEMLQSVLDEQINAPKNVLKIIEAVSQHNNTPRKKPRFINFVKNVCGSKTNPKDIDQAWDFIAVKLTALSNATNRNQNNKKDDKSDDGEQKENTNGTIEQPAEEPDDSSQNSADVHTDEAPEVLDEKRLTKKQRKEEKKRKKYEAALQSAEAPPPEENQEEEADTKKGKKKKNKSESGDTHEGLSDGKNSKNNKRKRQDTVNSEGHHEPVVDPQENGIAEAEEVAPVKKTVPKKKQKADESICLHDQNVAKIEELAVSGDKFNWHNAIMSVLEKKGNEVLFKRLQKKVLTEYSEATGREIDDRIADKFIKKLKGTPNVRVDKNRVTLIN